MRSLRKLSVIFPYYHESRHTLIRGIDSMQTFLKKENVPHEIIISQNGQNHKVTIDNPVVSVVFDRKRGLGRAFKNAIKVATGEYCYFISIEIPFNFSDLKRMLTLYQHYDLLIGSKLHHDSIYKISPLRNFLSRSISLTAKLLLPRFTVNDPNGTLFGKTHQMQEFTREIKSNDFFFGTEMVYLYARNRLKIREVPVNYIKDDTASSVNILDGFKYVLRLFLYAFQIRFSHAKK